MGLERGMQAVVTAAVFTAWAFLFVVIRCISRFCIIKQGGMEDYLAILALVLSIGLTVIIGLRECSNYPFGKYCTDSTVQNEKMALGDMPILLVRKRTRCCQRLAITMSVRVSLTV